MATGVSKTKWKGNGSKSNDNFKIKSDLDIKLQYKGKKSLKEVLKTKKSVNKIIWPDNCASENRLFYGDNINILASLLEDTNLKNRIKLIYIDPPFATSSVFKSRSQKDAYTDLISGSNYIEFIRERLILLKELLAKDGSIYVHLDANMAFEIKIIMDEIFGKKNFRNWITRKKCSSKNFTYKSYGKISDYILFYTKTSNYIWNRPYGEWSDDWIKKEYPFIDEKTQRRYKRVPLHAPGVRGGETGKTWRGLTPPPGKHWQFTPKKLEELELNGEIYWSKNGNPRRKVFFDKSKGVSVQDIWLEYRDAHNQNIMITGYPTEKNADMIARIILASSNPGDIVMDCFSGSGTTLEVAHKFNRNWIGIDNSPIAIETTLKRFFHGTEKMGDYVQKGSIDNSIQKSIAPYVFNNRNQSGKKITDFGIYVTDNYNNELDEILARMA